MLSGYGFMLSLYFYMGARLTPFMVLAVIGYMFLLMPVVRIPGAYFDLRRVTPGLGRLRALGRAISGQARSVLHYFGQLMIFAIACFCFAGPWLMYYIDNQAGANSRTNEKLIFSTKGGWLGSTRCSTARFMWASECPTATMSTHSCRWFRTDTDERAGGTGRLLAASDVGPVHYNAFNITYE